MPNHVTNRLTLSGPGAHAFMMTMINRHGMFDFHRIAPIPKALNIPSSSSVERLASLISKQQPRGMFGGEGVTDFDLAIAEMKEQLGPQYPSVLKDARQYLRNIEVYGYPTWYEANNALWGTKWNAYSEFFPEVPSLCSPRERVIILPNGSRRRQVLNEGYAKRQRRKQLKAAKVTQVVFDTAWSTPEGIWNHMMAKMPEGVIANVMYADEDLGSNCGEFSFRRGELLEEDHAPSWSEMDAMERRKWRGFAFHVCYGEYADPGEHDMDENYEYVEDEE
jgi:hypothetical protein